MKTKLFLFTVIFAVFIVACNQSKKTDEKQTETTEIQPETPEEPVSMKGNILNSETGEGISMAIVIVKGTTTGTMSGPNGEFAITAPGGAKKLVISADGFEPKEIDIDSENEMEVKLTAKS